MAHYIRRKGYDYEYLKTTYNEKKEEIVAESFIIKGKKDINKVRLIIENGGFIRLLGSYSNFDIDYMTKYFGCTFGEFVNGYFMYHPYKADYKEHTMKMLK